MSNNMTMMDVDTPSMVSGRKVDFFVFLRELSYETQKLLWFCLSPADILNLSNTCKDLQSLRSLWNINSHLCKFVRDPLEFRRVMAKSNAIVGGANAVQFLEMVEWKGSSLDLFVPWPYGDNKTGPLVAFIEHLISREGYYWVPYTWQAGSYNSTHAMVETSIRPAASPFKMTKARMAEAKLDTSIWHSDLSQVFRLQRRDGNIIHIMATLRMNAAESLFNDFFSTLDMTFYTWNKAISLFPYLNFVKRRAILLHPFEAGYNPYAASLVQHGYSYNFFLESEIPEARAGLGISRGIMDSRHSWTVDLDTTGVVVSDLKLQPLSLLELAFFSTTIENDEYHDTDPPIVSFYWRASYRVFRSCVLEYEYICDANSSYSGNVNQHKTSWFKELMARSEMYTKTDSLLFQDEDVRRRAAITPLKFPASYRFPDPKPPGFRYRDNEVPEWFVMWKQGKGLVHQQ